MVYLMSRYALVSVMATLLVIAVSQLLETYARIDVGWSGAPLPFLIAAIDAGRTYFKRWDNLPSCGFAWGVSAGFVLINGAVALVLLLAILRAYGLLGNPMGVESDVGDGLIVFFLLIAFCLFWPLVRFFFGFGAKNELKMQEKLAAKKQP